MSISTPPPPQKKKSGCGCFGCGCFIVILLLLLLIGLIVGGGYFGYKNAYKLTSTAPSDVPLFTGGEDIYKAAQQKTSELQHDIETHQTGSIHLSADEINSLIAHDPTLTQRQDRMFVTFTDNQAQVQGSLPTDSIPILQSVIKDRYINFDTTFGLNLDSSTKSLDIDLHHMQIGNVNAPSNALPTLQAELTPVLNMQIQNNASLKNLLQQAKTIEIENGEMVIETK